MSDTNTEAMQFQGGELEPPRGGAHPVRDVAILSAALFALTAAFYIGSPDRGVPIRDAGPWMFVLVAAAFAGSELSGFRITFRRQSTAYSLSEVPTAFCLVFLAPGPALLARLVGCVGVILLFRRPSPSKLIFNLALVSFELALGVFLLRGFVAEREVSDPLLLVAVIAVTFLVSIVASVLLLVAISRYEGGAFRKVLAEMRLSWWLLLVNATLAGMVLSLALLSPLLALTALVPLAMLWHVIQEFGSVDQRLRDLNAVHGFTGRVGQSLEPGEIGRAAVVEAAEILRADAGALVLFNNGTGPITQGFGDIGIRLPADVADPNWAGYIESDAVELVAGERLFELPGATPATKPLLVAPIHDQTGPLGLLVIGNRPDSAPRFGSDDVTRLQNLTEQLAASLRRGLLHQRIEREAREDRLTGLPNRLAFERSLALAMQEDNADGQLFVILLDLDRFKEVNDTLGHNAGDELLITVSKRLALQLEPADVLARLAGDEFAIVGRRTHASEVTRLASACVRETGKPVTLDGLEIVVTASAGVAIVDPGVELEPDPEGDETTLLRHADIAMFNAKSQHLGVEVYRDEIDRRTPARLSMLGDLRAAIEDQRLQVHLQPKLDLTSGLIVGAEALVRWTHPVRGVVPPAHFVRVAEDTGLIKQLTDLMLRRGIYHIREIHDRGYHLGLSVNLSTHDLLDTRLAGRVEEHLRINGVDPGMLTLEITESSLLIDAPRARATINELHEVGVQLSIDDFGTGYSSLSYLRRLPVGELKIDQSFVANVLLDEQDEVIVRSTIDLGHNLGLVVVAEGVENNEVLERLKAFGCDVAQGFCVSRPLPPEHLISWLATTTHPSRTVDPLDYTRWNTYGGPAANPPTNPAVHPRGNPGEPPTPGTF